MNISDFFKDPTIRRIMHELETDARLRIDMSLIDELERYTRYAKQFDDISHASYKTLADLHGLAAEFERVQFARGRAISIKIGHLPIAKILRRFWSAGTTALYNGFPEIAKVSPVARKDQLIATILAPLRERLDNVEVVLEAATEVERLLGNGHFSLMELKQINVAHIDAVKQERNR